MRYAFIINPAARNKRAGRARPALEAALRAAGVTYTVLETEAPSHAERLARTATADHDVVVAVGGDGTIHEVARGLYGTDTRMGVLPLGTGNDFAHAIGMPDNLQQAVRALLAAEPVPVDIGRVRWQERADGGALVTHEALFTNCLGTGFDALAALGAQRFKFLGGRTAYLASVLRALWVWRQPTVEVNIQTSMTADSEAHAATEAAGASAQDGALVETLPQPGPSGDDAPIGLAPGEGETMHQGRFFLVEVGNGFSVGGGFLLTPDAVVDDGLFDVCLVDHVSIKRVLQVIPKAFTGSHVTEPEVTMRHARRVTLRSTEPLPVHADGEILTTGARTVDVEILPGTIQLLAPKIRRPGAS